MNKEKYIGVLYATTITNKNYTHTHTHKTPQHLKKQTEHQEQIYLLSPSITCQGCGYFVATENFSSKSNQSTFSQLRNGY